MILCMVHCAWSIALAQDYKLWYDKPAQHWLEALPVGNSHLGAMVYGGTDTEEIQLNGNEKSLGKKINKASEISILSSRGADTYIEEYSKVYDSNKLLFNLFDHALEQMFPPYIATNVKDIKKFRLEMEELDSKF